MRTEKNEQEHDLIAIISLVVIVTIVLIAGLLTIGVNPEMVKDYFDDGVVATSSN